MKPCSKGTIADFHTSYIIKKIVDGSIATRQFEYKDLNVLILFPFVCKQYQYSFSHLILYKYEYKLINIYLVQKNMIFPFVFLVIEEEVEASKTVFVFHPVRQLVEKKNYLLTENSLVPEF